MANPQVENGYTKIANELLDALCKIRVPGEARQCLDTVLRKTYGFGKTSDSISLSQFTEMTGLDKPDVCRALAKLQMMNLVIGEKANDKKTVTKYRFNKNHENWVPLAKKIISIGEKAKGGSKKPLKNIEVPLAKKPHTKEIYTKETITKESMVATQLTNKEKTTMFFESVSSLRNWEVAHKNQPELPIPKQGEIAIEFLTRLTETSKLKKTLVWVEVKRFCDYWTEETHSGRYQKWQIEKTFMIEKRLIRWFSKFDHKGISFSEKQTQNRGKGSVGLEDVT